MIFARNSQSQDAGGPSELQMHEIVSPIVVARQAEARERKGKEKAKRELRINGGRVGGEEAS